MLTQVSEFEDNFLKGILMIFIRKQIFFLFFLFFLISSNVNAQVRNGIGASLGGGVLSGNSPNQTSFSASLFLESNLFFTKDVITRLSFLYSADIDQIFTAGRKNYYPFLKGISLEGIVNQNQSNNFFTEEGIGLLLLNDRTFSDVDTWNYGIVFSVLGGVDFRTFNPTGVTLGLGAEYGMTFNNSLAKYFSIYLETRYIF